MTGQAKHEPRPVSVDGSITWSDGTTTRFLVSRNCDTAEVGSVQWAGTTAELGRNVLLLEYIRDGLEAEDGSEDDAEPEPENPCSECGEETEDDIDAGYGMCGSCLHNALRSGWTPGAEA